MENFGDSKHEEILDSGLVIVDSRVQSTGFSRRLPVDREPTEVGTLNSRQPKAAPVIKLTPGATQNCATLGVDDRDSI
jgi:hypothetical protein